MEIQDIVDNVDIVDYISQYVDLTESNGELWGLCPFHDENTPSFSVTPDTGLYYCFGCGFGGNILNFIQKYHHLTFKQAVSQLCAYAGISDDQVSDLRPISALRVMRKYRERGRCTKSATYKTLDPDIMSRYEYNEAKFKPWLAEGIGLDQIRKYQVRYDSFANRLVYPIRTIDGQIINISGRTLVPDFKEKRIRKYSYYYDLGILDTMFGYYENLATIKSKREIILFEGAKSVMLAEAYGVTNSVAAMTSHLNECQLALLIKLGCRVVFAFDSDVDIRKDDQIQKLKHFVSCEWVRNRDGLLEDKMAPVDAGQATWETLYERRGRL